MRSTLLERFTVAVFIAGFVVFKHSVIQKSSTNAVHTFFFHVTNTRSIGARSRVKESYSILSVFTSIARTIEIEVFFSERIKATHSFLDLFFSA